jgi:hypothetical protein
MSCKSHCCVKHGCKYGRERCPVVNKREKQLYPCEFCHEEKLRRARKPKPANSSKEEYPDVEEKWRREFRRILNENACLLEQVKMLQMDLTMKEEHLRAHRRVDLSSNQKAALQKDLDKTTLRVKNSYKTMNQVSGHGKTHERKATGR